MSEQSVVSSSRQLLQRVHQPQRMHRHAGAPGGVGGKPRALGLRSRPAASACAGARPALQHASASADEGRGDVAQQLEVGPIVAVRDRPARSRDGSACGRLPRFHSAGSYSTGSKPMRQHQVGGIEQAVGRLVVEQADAAARSSRDARAASRPPPGRCWRRRACPCTSTARIAAVAAGWLASMPSSDDGPLGRVDQARRFGDRSRRRPGRAPGSAPA